LNDTEIRISGIVIPSNWDDDGRPTVVSLATADETIELIADQVTEKELAGLIRKKVEIVGRKRKKAKKNTILVKDYFLKKKKPITATET